MGYGVVEDRRGRLFHLAHGVIRANPQAPLEDRLHQIFIQLSSTISIHRPDCVAVEGVFHCRNARSALILGHARGIALLVAARGGLAVHEYSPANVKRSVGAGGGGGKDAVAKMVHRFLQIQKPDRLDASDALAVAICHLNHAHAVPSVLPGRALAGLGSFAKRLSPAYQRFGAQ
jgi:crossover junction endodeoxyribonuclease RuvC